MNHRKCKPHGVVSCYSCQQENKSEGLADYDDKRFEDSDTAWSDQVDTTDSNSNDM